MTDCTCPECEMERLHDRQLLWMLGIVAFLTGCMVAVVRWAW